MTRRLYTVILMATVFISPPARAKAASPEEWLEGLVDNLGEFRPHASVCGQQLELTLAVDADDASHAGSRAESAVTDTLRNLNIRYDGLSLQQVVNDGYLQAQLDDLIGLSEIADLLGVSQQRASQLSRDSGFPGSIRRVAGRAVWSRKEVERFKRDVWNNKRGPRRSLAPVGSVVET